MTDQPGKGSMMGSYMVVASGKAFWPLDPRPDHVDIEDIAHGLSNICRFGGHTSRFYSVAQHSVLVSLCVPEDLALFGLLHDAAEAYVGDMVRPLKYNSQCGSMGSRFVAIENKILAVILDKFGLSFGDLTMWGGIDDLRDIPLIREADDRVLIAEARDFMGNPGWISKYKLEPYPHNKIRPLLPSAAKKFFLRRYRELTKD